ncbi:MAG TPA: hypothetical protein V6C91_05545 [Coleofasciculaceae cyanobacterium]
MTVMVGANPPWLPRQGLGAGTEALPLRKIVVLVITVPALYPAL